MIKDFIPSTINQTSAQVWIYIHGLPQEYWRRRIIFVIVSSIGTRCVYTRLPTRIHLIKLLVTTTGCWWIQIYSKSIDTKSWLKERVLHSFLEVKYERLPYFYSLCSSSGHTLENCKRNNMQDKGKIKVQTKEDMKKTCVEKQKE